MIGDDIQIRVLSMDGLKVRLGIDAPKNIEVHRQEIYERIQKNKLKSINDSFIQDQAQS